MKYALFDASWLAYRAKYALGPLSHGDLQTGIVFGFLEQLRATAADSRVATNAIALCFDDRESFRRQSFPGYKARRAANKPPEELAEALALRDQMERLRKEILPAAGFNCLGQAGLESDDVMAQAAMQISAMGSVDTGVIVTADNDLYQMITERVDWYDPARNLYLDYAGIHAKLGIPSSSWARVKCIAGCAGDDVPGVPNVGVKTATDYLLGLIKHGARFEAIESLDGRLIAMRNMELVCLPHPRTEPVELKAPAYDPAAFYRAAEKNGFASYLSGPRRKAWDSFFAGDFSSTRQKARRRGE